MNLGYLGPEGTFSEQAAMIYSNTDKLIPFNSISELILAVNNKKIDQAIVPIENSIEGPINLTLDMLAWEVDLKIKDEVVISIKQCLMGNENTDIKNIKQILSHPQPIGQCSKFINTYFPNVDIKYTQSTSQAAYIVSQNSENIVAIASKHAAIKNNLKIIYEDIQDNINNMTRFVVLTKDDDDILQKNIDNINKCKTSIVFSTENEPGSLYKVLQILNLWDINMTRIESRPSKDCLGKYIFFVDFEGCKNQSDIKDALSMIKRKTSFCKLLGSYKSKEY